MKQLPALLVTILLFLAIPSSLSANDTATVRYDGKYPLGLYIQVIDNDTVVWESVFGVSSRDKYLDIPSEYASLLVEEVVTGNPRVAARFMDSSLITDAEWCLVGTDACYMFQPMTFVPMMFGE